MKRLSRRIFLLFLFFFSLITSKESCLGDDSTTWDAMAVVQSEDIDFINFCMNACQTRSDDDDSFERLVIILEKLETEEAFPSAPTSEQDSTQ